MPAPAEITDLLKLQKNAFFSVIKIEIVSYYTPSSFLLVPADRIIMNRERLVYLKTVEFPEEKRQKQPSAIQ